MAKSTRGICLTTSFMAKASSPFLILIHTGGNCTQDYLKTDHSMATELCSIETVINVQPLGSEMKCTAKVRVVSNAKLTLRLIVGIYTWANGIHVNVTFKEGEIRF